MSDAKKPSKVTYFLQLFTFLIYLRIARLLWGEGVFWQLLVSLVGITLVLWAVVLLLQHIVRRQLDALDPRDVESLRAEDPGLAEFLADRPRMGERKDWAWRIYSVGWAVIALIYPPVATTLIRTGGFSLETAFTIYELLAMVAGVAAYFVIARWRLKRYRCRRCGSVPIRLEGETARFSCARCGIVWNLGV